MNNETLKTAICDALAAWIRQRPRLEPGNYDAAGYRSDSRLISQQKRDAEALLMAVRYNGAVSAQILQDAFKHSFSGRLRCEMKLTRIGPPRETTPIIEYDTGQYWCTEYRAAAAAVLAGALWAAARDADNGYSAGFKSTAGREPDANELRQHFRKDFGSRLQRRWFN